MISSAEPFDVAFSAYWGGFDFYQNAAKGAYLPLNDLLDKNAPQSKARVPASAWGSVTVNGKIYAIPNYQQWGLCNQYGFYLKKACVEKYNFDYKKMTKWSDLTPYLEAVKKGEPAGTIPMEYAGGGTGDWFASTPMLFGFDGVGDTRSVGAVRYDDSSAKVINQYDTQEYKDYLTTERDWYLKGYIKKDAATLKDIAPDRKAEKVAATVSSGVYVDESKLNVPRFFSMSDPTHKVYSVNWAITKPMMQASKGAEACLTVGANSQNPDRALQWIELVNSDQTVWNLLNWGREGIDYTRVDDHYIKRNLDSYDFHYADWVVGQSNGRDPNYAYVDQGGNWEDNKLILDASAEADKTVQPSPVSGFVFNAEPVKTEIANCNTVLDEMVAALGSGSIDPVKNLPIFLEKLKTAGADKIIAEKQKQIDAWKAANGK
jgi:putative aldouronate transport system substrate-binding protein